MTPPKTWAEADVPLAMPNCLGLIWHEPSMQRTYPSWSAAVMATSGTNRAFVAGIPATPACQIGFEKAMLCPPPLDQRPEAGHPGCPTCATRQLSFQTFSGMYDLADPPVVGSLEVFQYVLEFAESLNCVPPTATVKGVEASRLTDAGV